MKRSEINGVLREAQQRFAESGWVLPPNPRWDVTDFGLEDFDKCGLVCVNLAEEKEYCEKLMFARESQVTPLHTHHHKKEDIICRHGQLCIELWVASPNKCSKGTPGVVRRNGEEVAYQSGDRLLLQAGERVTIEPCMVHSFWPVGGSCVIGEVSTANDDHNDNHFENNNIGRFPAIEEDESPLLSLISEVYEVQSA